MQSWDIQLATVTSGSHLQKSHIQTHISSADQAVHITAQLHIPDLERVVFPNTSDVH